MMTQKGRKEFKMTPVYLDNVEVKKVSSREIRVSAFCGKKFASVIVGYAQGQYRDPMKLIPFAEGNLKQIFAGQAKA